MQILQIVPKNVEIVFSLSLDDVRKLECAFNVSEFDLDQTRPEEKDLFDTTIKFHNLLKGLVKEIDNA